MKAFLASIVAIVVISLAAWMTLDQFRQSTAGANQSPNQSVRLD